MNNLIIIGGCMWSGTTLLATIIDTHKNIACGPETYFLIDRKLLNRLFYKFRISYRINDKLKISEFNHIKKRLLKFPHVNEEKLNQIFYQSNLSRSIFVKKFFSEYLVFKNKKRWADKTPGNTFFVKALSEYYPDAKFIHIVRDFWDVYLSLRKYASYNNIGTIRVNIYRAAYYWNRNYDVIRQIKADKALREKTFILRYEDLILDTKNILKKIFRFLEEEFDDDCLKYYLFSHDLQIKPHINSVRKPINKNSCFKYKKLMNSCEKKISLILCGKILKHFNYDT